MKKLSREEFKRECNRIQTYGKNDLQINEADLQSILNHDAGSLFMDVYMGRCDNVVRNALLQLYMRNYERLSCSSAVLVNFNMHPDYSLTEINEGVSFLGESLPEHTNIAFTITCDDDTVAKDFAKVTIIMAGIIESVDSIVEEVTLCFETNKALNDKFINLAQKHKKTKAEFLEEILNEYCREKPVNISDLIIR